MSKALRIQVVQHVWFERPGWIRDWAVERGHSLSVNEVEQGLPKLEDSDFLILLGGTMSVHDRHKFAWMAKECALIEEFIAAKKPLLGICLGAQLIAHVLGATVRNMPQREIGWFDLHFGSDIYFSPLKGKAFLWHGEEFTLPEGATALARSERTGVQAFSYGAHAVALQFHPEVNSTEIQLLIKECGQYINTAAPGEQSAAQILSGLREHGQAQRDFIFALLDRMVCQSWT
jgi:GMP synthase-like glutamine amidotransferase